MPSNSKSNQKPSKHQTKKQTKKQQKRKSGALDEKIGNSAVLDSAQFKPTAPKTRKLMVVDASDANEGLGSEAHYNGVVEDAGERSEWGLGDAPAAAAPKFKTSAADVEELGMTAFEGRDKRAAEKKRLERIGARYMHNIRARA
jgi:hypothetical protein